MGVTVKGDQELIETFKKLDKTVESKPVVLSVTVLRRLSNSLKLIHHAIRPALITLVWGRWLTIPRLAVYVVRPATYQSRLVMTLKRAILHTSQTRERQNSPLSISLKKHRLNRNNTCYLSLWRTLSYEFARN